VFVFADESSEDLRAADVVDSDRQWEHIGVVGRCPFIEGSAGSSAVVVVGDLVELRIPVADQVA
jgi:hypothetical protein